MACARTVRCQSTEPANPHNRFTTHTPLLKQGRATLNKPRPQLARMPVKNATHRVKPSFAPLGMIRTRSNATRPQLGNTTEVQRTSGPTNAPSIQHLGMPVSREDRNTGARMLCGIKASLALSVQQMWHKCANLSDFKATLRPTMPH